jgi:hypothetical protein
MQHYVKQHQENWHPYQRVSQSICQMIYEGTVTSPEEENSHTVKKVNLVHYYYFEGAILHFSIKTTKLSTFYCQGLSLVILSYNKNVLEHWNIGTIIKKEPRITAKPVFRLSSFVFRTKFDWPVSSFR